MNAILKRVVSLILCFMLIVGYVPVNAFAEETGETVTTEATDVTTAPTDAVSDETEAPSESTEAPTDPSEETSEPTDAATAPTEAPTEPTDATTVPTGAATVPTEAPTEPVTTEPVATVKRFIKGSAVAATGNTQVAATFADLDTNTDYVFLATDRHANTSVIGDIINNMESKIGENMLDYLGLGGDMVGSGNSHPAYNSSTVLGEATGATSSLSADNVDIVAGIHDMNVTDDVGIVLPYESGGAQIYEGDRFYVYGVPESCISGAVSGVDPETEANDFVTWANGSGIDKSKVIIVVSHYPLHQRRNDNIGAAYWATALNTVAVGDDTTIDRDVAFFWGHNHTGETSADTAVYHVAPGKSISVQGGSSSQTIYFTYANAGYLNDKSAATLVTITDEKLTFDKYVSSSVSTSNTVTRVKEAVTLSSIAISGNTEYTVGDVLGLTVIATYSDGTTADVTSDATLTGYDMYTAGTQTVTATYEDQTATVEITVSEAENEVTENTWYSDDTFAAVTATATNATLEEVLADTKADALLSYWFGYTISLDGQVEETTATVKLWLDPNGSMSSENLAVYHLNEETGEYELVTGYTVATDEDEVEYISIENAAQGTYVYGTPNTDDVIPEDAVLDSIVIEEPATTTKYFDTDVDTYTDAEGNTCTAIAVNISDMVVKANYVLDGTTYSKTIQWNKFGTIADGYALSHDPLIVDGQVQFGEKTVTLTYGDKTAQYSIWVCKENETIDDVTVSFDTPSVVSVTAVPVEVTETINTALADKLTGTLVSYDITAEYANGDTALSGTATITLPIPADVTNPVVYYVSDDGQTVENMNAVDNGDGTVSFKTTHFSTYVVGDSTEITVPDPTTQTVTGATTTEKKTVYVLTSSISSGTSYLVVNGNSAGSYYALANNSGSVAATGVTVKTDSTIGTYIELTDATDELWTVSDSSSISLKNGSYYLTYSGSRGNYSLDLSTSSTSWTYSSNSLSITPNKTTYYLVYDSGWGMSASSDNVYFYVPTEIDVTVSADGTYSIAGTPAEVSKVVVEGTTTTLGSTLTFVSESGTTTTTDTSATAKYTVVDGGDPNGIITGISGNTVTFTGAYGKALVKVSYTVTVNDADYTVDNYITVTATEPTYAIEITETETDEAGNRGAGEVITETVSIKGDGTSIPETYDLWAKVTYTDAGGEQELVLDADKLTWSSNNTSVATVDEDGIVHFVGNEGTVQITVYYEYDDGKSVTDTVTFSVTLNPYTVPSDGTDDFPEYPNEGAIRFDKTAVAVGNFSETGIAQVELSMTGVPYSKGSEIDVVIMLDMTGSMSDTAMAAAEESAIAFAEQIVKNEDGTYNDNRIAILAFNSGSSSPYTYWELGTVDSDDEWNTLCTAVRSASDNQVSGGTPYDEALAKCQEILAAAKIDGTGDDRQQFCVFVSDGGPTSYKYITNYDAVKAGTASAYTTSTATATGGANQSDSNFATIATYTHEYYSTLMKDAGVTMYSVLTGLSAADYPNCTTILQNIASDSSKAYVVEDGSDTSALSNAFANIAMEIKQAATDVVVEDKIDSHYTVNFSLPSGVTSTEAGMSEFYIQAVQYNLDANKERTGDPTVLEKFTFNADGTLKSHTVDGAACGDTCSHVTIEEGKVTAITGTYFQYSIDENGDEFLTWEAEKLDTTELALQYYVYLDKSAGYDAENQVEAGTYPTNEYATLTYTNFNGNECRQYFPVPSMTWMGAQVTYVFYLVNEDGQPVNRAGRVVPFAEAVYVTDPVTYDVTWNENTGVENILAENLFASAKVPDVYSLYDTDAKYVIRVYETENVDTNGVNGNYFQISGATDKLIDSEMDTDTTADNSTTKVFNTKVGVKYDKYGIYSQYDVGTTLTDGTNDITTTVKTTDIDYANTTVAFAVVWKPELVEDTVVVDYGLDVVIDVTTNDAMAAGVTGVMAAAPSNVEINSGTYTTAVSEASITDTDGVWTASKESLTSVRFHQNNMQMDEPAEFYYEAGVNYYIYDANNNATLNTTNMYSKVTVIPATTIYYEDSFVDLASFSKGTDGTFTEDATSKWTTDGTTVNATQDQDRPGASQISAALDADNNYGYDSAYTNMSTHSMGSAAKITVDADTRGEATFTFYGTGFDIIGMTSNTTGTLTVQVYSGAAVSDTAVKTSVVDTYYGYAYQNGEWVVVNSNDTNALYQVPVMKIFGLDYGQYTVKLTAGYNSYFDHNDAGSYDLYLDAVRIYDPTGNKNTTANNAYVADGEGWPTYFEVRDQIISKSTFDSLNSDEVSGIVFIDGISSCAAVADYTSYGPNNETYLDAEQAIAFDLNATAVTDTKVAKIQLAVKSVGGTGSVEVYGVKDGTEVACLSEDISTATDMYYDITALNGMTVVIKNSGDSDDAIISITNVKVTYTAEQNATETTGVFALRRSSVDAALATMSVEEDTAPETTDPSESETTEPSEPETTEPSETEITEPETTVPEETEPENDSNQVEEAVKEAVKNVINTVKNALKNLFSRWFR